jgi:hypothetical protein
MNQVGFDEYRAPFPHSRRLFGREGKSAKFPFDGNVQFFGLLFQERPGSCCTDLVHFKVNHHPIIKADIFRVLSPDLKNRIHGGIDMDGCCGLSRDLITHQISSDEISSQVTPGPGCPHSLDLHPFTDLLSNFLKTRSDRFDGPTGGHQISLGENLLLSIDNNKIGADRTDIQTEIGLDFLFTYRIGKGLALNHVRFRTLALNPTWFGAVMRPAWCMRWR